MKRTIWIIRHAQSEGNKKNIIQGHFDTELTDLGYRQARQTADWFYRQQSLMNVKSIYSSDLKRAKSTAVEVAKKFNLSVQTKELLREAYFGKWEGLNGYEVEKEDPENYRRWKDEKRWRPSWCESFESLQERSKRVLKEIFEENSGEKDETDIIVASHGGFIYSLLCNWLDDYRGYIQNCGISVLEGTSIEDIKIKMISFLAPYVEISPEMAKFNPELIRNGVAHSV